jgi:hypothetical protein
LAGRSRCDANCIGIADVGAAEVEALAQVVGVGDDQFFHVLDRLRVGEIALAEIFAGGGRRKECERRFVVGVTAGAPGLPPDGVIEL